MKVITIDRLRITLFMIHEMKKKYQRLISISPSFDANDPFNFL